MKAKFILLIFLSFSFTSIVKMHGQSKEADYRRHAEIMAKLSKHTLRSAATQDPDTIGANSRMLHSETNLPRPGDQIVKLEASYLSPGNSGKEVVWDFNTLQLNGNEYPVNYFETSQTPLAGIENGSMQTYQIGGNSFSLKINEDPYTIIHLEKPEEIMIFPVTFGNEKTGYFYGKGKYCDRLGLNVAGLNYTKVDGYGTLILPENDTITDVVRIYTAKITSTYSQPITPGFNITTPRDTALSYNDIYARLEQDSACVITETYRWYVEGNRYPVLETVQTSKIMNGKIVSSGKQAYVFHPLDQQELPEDKANQAILADKSAKKNSTQYSTGKEKWNINSGWNIQTYPNPVVNQLVISLQLETPEEIQVFVYNLQGQLIYKRELQSQSGNHTETVDMSRLAKGSYVLQVQAEGKSERKVIVKQ